MENSKLYVVSSIKRDAIGKCSRCLHVVVEGIFADKEMAYNLVYDLYDANEKDLSYIAQVDTIEFNKRDPLQILCLIR